MRWRRVAQASELVGGDDRSAGLRVIGLLFGQSLVVSFYGLVVQFALARQGGRPGGGNVAPFAYSYSAAAALLAFTMLVCFVLNAWLAATGFSTIVHTLYKCKKLNSLQHLVRTTVAGSHN